MTADPRPTTVEGCEFCGSPTEAHNIGCRTAHLAANTRVAEMAAELRQIDAVLARRPALAECTTRAQSIERAINAAIRGDDAREELHRLRELAREVLRAVSAAGSPECDYTDRCADIALDAGGPCPACKVIAALSALRAELPEKETL
jgi:hypothetical protein